MKVWIENPFDNLPLEGHRPQRYWLMAEAFARAGHEVVLWTSDFSHATKQKRVIRMEPDCARDGFRVVMVPTRPYAKNVSLARIRSHRDYARRWLELAHREIAEKGKPDLLIISMPPLATGDVAIQLKRETGCRLVADIMDAWPETFFRLVPRRLRFLAPIPLLPLRLAADRLYRAADLVTCVCDAYCGLAKSRGAKDCYRAYHGFPFGSAAEVPRREKGNVRLVYIGNLGRGYDLSAPIEATLADPSVELDVAGAGDLEPTWRELAGDCQRIRFHGYVGSDVLGRLLGSATIGIVPLSDETCVGLPYKLGDYAAYGLPVVTSLRGECAAFLERYQSGAVYESGNVESFCAAVAKVKTMVPDQGGIRKELDSGVIYPDYVREVLARC